MNDEAAKCPVFNTLLWGCVGRVRVGVGTRFIIVLMKLASTIIEVLVRTLYV